MLRFSFAIVALIVSIQCCSPAEAQRFRGGRGLFGFGFGIQSDPVYRNDPPGTFNPNRFDSYVHDPYRFGSFEAPDLLNDPYFRERHRYDSAFPGRRHDAAQRERYLNSLPRGQKPRLQLKPHAMAPPPYVRAEQTHRATEDFAGLATPVATLHRGLGEIEDGEVWQEYLGTERLEGLMESGDVEQLAELLTHFEGVTANAELRHITRIQGFSQTRELLRQRTGVISDDYATGEVLFSAPR